MKAARACGVGIALALLIFALAASRDGASAAELLANPGFDSWSGGSPDGWTATPASSVSEETSRAVSGSGLAAAAGTVTLRQFVPAVPGASYAGHVSFASDGLGNASLRIAFKDDGFTAIHTILETAAATSAFTTLTGSGEAPLFTAWIEFSVLVEGSDVTFVDEAGLSETLPAATPTPEPPTETAVPTATPTAPPPTATPVGATATPSSSATTASTATSTRTATPTRTPTSTRTPTPGPSGGGGGQVILPTATPAGGGAGSGGGGGQFGGLLLNGDFELGDLADGTKPKHWAKFGGEMSLSPFSYRGASAGQLMSITDSTKWLTQLVRADAGKWYRARGFARVAGPGEVFIRLSWYPFTNGDGSAIRQDDSPASAAGTWTALDSGPIQAPVGAYSVRVRLMFRPSGNATAFFDDVSFVETDPPPPATATPTAGGANVSPSATRSATVAATPRSTSTPRPAGGTGAASPRATPIVSTVVVVPGPLSLRLSEVMSDPAEVGRDGAFEWVELVNVGTEPVSLAGWMLADGSSADILPDVSVPAGGYVVIAGASADLPGAALVVRVSDGQIGGGLNNDGDALALVAPDGTTVDSMSYGADATIFDPAPAAPEAGETLGVRTAGADPDAENWSITLRPTPGEPNIFPAPTRDEDAVAGERTAGPQAGDEPRRLVSDADGGSSTVPWIILGGALGIGVTFAGIKGAAPARAWATRRITRGR